MKRYLYFALLSCICIIAGCAKQPPLNTADACEMLEDNTLWYSALEDSEQRWGISKSVILATIKQESSFRSNVQPPRTKLLGFIPWFRPSSAYGYSQALDEVWDEYKTETGEKFARRNSFVDSADFVGWYHNKTAQQLNISRNNGYALYLAYHEGRGGYKRKTYLQKNWLISAAKKVRKHTKLYAKQIKMCDSRLQRAWYDFIPFL